MGNPTFVAGAVSLHHSCNPILEKLALELQVKHLRRLNHGKLFPELSVST
jgi:hypothetical protein